MSANKAKNTKPELILRRALCKNHLSGYRLHWNKAPGHPDISYPGKKIAIFVNGCFWHRCPYCKPSFPKTHVQFWKKKFKNNVARDQRKNKELCDQGWKVIIAWECRIREDPQIYIRTIRDLITGTYQQ
jgi:DNA mismatch endonuclease, patch repair protein